MSSGAIRFHPAALEEAEAARDVLHRFPYLVVFREQTFGVEIIAIAYGHRRAKGDWLADKGNDALSTRVSWSDAYGMNRDDY